MMMTTMLEQGHYGLLTEPATLTITRLLPGPATRLWAYLTDGELRRQWLAAGAMEQMVGAPIDLVWRNDELTDPPGTRPDGFGAEHRMTCEVTATDARQEERRVGEECVRCCRLRCASF